MSSSLFAAQEAVYTLLEADSTLQSYIGAPTRLYDSVPASATFPYVTLGDVQLRDFDTKDASGFEQTLILHVWSRYRGRKEAKEIMQAVYDALHQQPLTIAGARFVDCRLQNASLAMDQDGLTLHGILRFRLIVQH